MQCPIDGSQLVMADRSGVEIDYCPQCRGVWLDRGELDKIIERSVPTADPQSTRQAAPRGQDRGHDKRSDKKKKLGGFLEDLFDF